MVLSRTTLDKWRLAFLALGLSVFMALLQLRLMMVFFDADYGRSINAGMEVLLGQPHWRTFQPRVLGPWLVERLSHLIPGANFAAAHLVYSLASLVAMGMLSWRIGWRVGGTRASALVGFLVAQMAFTFMLMRPWLYAWDFSDIIVFLLFVDFVVAGKGWHWFVVLFAVGIFSRQTVALIAVWMIVEGGLRRWQGKRLSVEERREDTGLIITGSVCLVGGAILVELLTRNLLVREIGPLIFHDTPDKGGVFQAMALERNLRIAFDAFTHVEAFPSLPIVAFLGLSLTMAIMIARKAPQQYLALGLVYGLHWIATLTFGLLTETRIYVEMIPLLVLATLMLVSDYAAPGSESV